MRASRGLLYYRVWGLPLPSVHWHGSVENVLLYGVSAIIVIDVLGISAAWLTRQNNPTVSAVGKALGAIVPFKG